MDMAADVRVFFVILSFLMLIKPSQSSDQGNPLGDIMGVLGALGDAAGTGNKCKYQCPNGVKPKANPRHKPSTNGCGSYGIELDTTEFPVLTECCNKHDMCYDTCGSERSDCDDIFKKCVKKSCKQMRTTGTINRQQYDGCQSMANLLHSATSLLGCNTFLESQKNACICQRHSDEL